MSSSSSSSTSSSPSPFSSHLLNIPIHRTMEQVWNDIHLSSRPLHNQNQNPSRQDPDFRSMQVFADFLARPFSKDNPPATTLSANSDHLRPISHFTSQFEASFGKKRFQESESSTCGDTDRRHKRMMKNRESAARSRARKQAYTNELELEAAHLMEENTRLRRQQEELCVATAAQLPKKHTLHRRTSTAPF